MVLDTMCMNCDNGCVPPCSDTDDTCSHDFISPYRVGAVYYEVALCCGSTWYTPYETSAFFSLDPFLLGLLILPSIGGIIEVIVNKIGIRKSTWSVWYESINTFIQLTCAIMSLVIYWAEPKYDLHKINSQCKIDHCRFLIHIATTLYKPFTIALISACEGMIKLFNNFNDFKQLYCMNSCTSGILFAFVIFLCFVFVLPIFFYSIILLIIGFPLYITLFLMLAIATAIGLSGMVFVKYLCGVTHSPEEELEIRKQYGSKIIVIYILTYFYVTLQFAKMYYGCGWNFTAVSVFKNMFPNEMSTSVAWPFDISPIAQITLAVSLSSGAMNAVFSSFGGGDFLQVKIDGV